MIEIDSTGFDRKMEAASNLRVSAREGGEILQTQTRENIKRMPNGASKPFTMKGTTVYPEDDVELYNYVNGSAVVRINPRGVMKWFEMGTYKSNPRTTRKGYSRGVIKPSWFFKMALEQSKSRIFNSMEHSLANQIREINNGNTNR